MPEHAAAVRRADATSYFTWQHPEEYYPDWRGYYERSLIERSRLQTRFEHRPALKYGDSPYQSANVWLPHQATDAPFILYFHGGRWREGHPDYYDPLATPWVEDGAVFGSFGYRLAPEHSIADAVADCLAAIAWARENAPAFGAHPRRLIVAGHSAGGHLAAMATLTDWAGIDTALSRSVVATICMSAPTDLRAEGTGADLADLSPALRIAQYPPAVVVSFGDPEPNKKSAPDTFLTAQGRLLVEALQAVGAPVQPVVLTGADHVGSATAFSDRSSPLFAAAYRAIFDVPPRDAE
jgi:arylformamidase